MARVVELQVENHVACSPRDARAQRQHQADDGSNMAWKKRSQTAASSESPRGTRRYGSPVVRRREFLLTASEQDIIFPATSWHLHEEGRALAESSCWAQKSSVSLRSVDGPVTSFSGAGFNPNQLGNTLIAQTGQRPGRAGDPTRLSDGPKRSWPPLRPPVRYSDDKELNDVVVAVAGCRTIKGACEVNRNLAGWQLSARSRPMSPRVYTNLRNPVKPPARSPQERLHGAPKVAHGSTSLVFGAATARTCSSFTPRHLSLGRCSTVRGETFSPVKGVPGPGLGFQFSPPRKPKAM